MQTLSFANNGLTASVSVPAGWDCTQTAVPNLVVPRQLFTLSNRSVETVPEGSLWPRPMIDDLDSAAILIWCYYQRPGDPQSDDIDAVPDYPEAAAIRWADTQPFGEGAQYTWDPTMFDWRRVGTTLSDGTAVSVWIWAGADATPSDVQAMEGAVDGITVESS